MEEFQPRDTTQIQQRSLSLFMAGLGYDIDSESTSPRFVTDLKHLQGAKYISWDVAQRLHNAETTDWVAVPDMVGLYRYGPVKLAFAMPAYNLVQLYAMKLVEKTKFLHIRKGGHKLGLKSPMIKPAHPFYLGMFGLL